MGIRSGRHPVKSRSCPSCPDAFRMQISPSETTVKHRSTKALRTRRKSDESRICFLVFKMFLRNGGSPSLGFTQMVMTWMWIPPWLGTAILRLQAPLMQLQSMKLQEVLLRCALDVIWVQLVAFWRAWTLTECQAQDFPTASEFVSSKNFLHLQMSFESWISCCHRLDMCTWLHYLWKVSIWMVRLWKASWPCLWWDAGKGATRADKTKRKSIRIGWGSGPLDISTISSHV